MRQPSSQYILKSDGSGPSRHLLKPVLEMRQRDLEVRGYTSVASLRPIKPGRTAAEGVLAVADDLAFDIVTFDVVNYEGGGWDVRFSASLDELIWDTNNPIDE